MAFIYRPKNGDATDQYSYPSAQDANVLASKFPLNPSSIAVYSDPACRTGAGNLSTIAPGTYYVDGTAAQTAPADKETLKAEIKEELGEEFKAAVREELREEFDSRYSSRSSDIMSKVSDAKFKAVFTGILDEQENPWSPTEFTGTPVKDFQWLEEDSTAFCQLISEYHQNVHNQDIIGFLKIVDTNLSLKLSVSESDFKGRTDVIVSPNLLGMDLFKQASCIIELKKDMTTERAKFKNQAKLELIAFQDLADEPIVLILSDLTETHIYWFQLVEKRRPCIQHVQFTGRNHSIAIISQIIHDTINKSATGSDPWKDRTKPVGLGNVTFASKDFSLEGAPSRKSPREDDDQNNSGPSSKKPSASRENKSQGNPGGERGKERGGRGGGSRGGQREKTTTRTYRLMYEEGDVANHLELPEMLEPEEFITEFRKRYFLVEIP